MIEEQLQLQHLGRCSIWDGNYFQCLGPLEVLLGIGPKLDRHVDGIFFGEPLTIEERTVLFPSSYKRIGTERLGGVIPSVDPGQFLKALPPLLSKHLLLTRQLLEGAEEKTLWRRRQHREKKREEKTLWRRCQHRYQRTCALPLADIFIFAILHSTRGSRRKER